MMEGFLEVVEKIKARIGRYEVQCVGNEALTRYILIDPLLRALGWDTEDPEKVIPEFRTRQGGRSDYALIGENRPIAMVEVEALNGNLHTKLTQLINYCLQDGIPYGIVTDGRRWELYNIFQPVPIDKKRIISFDLSSDDPYECALKALRLWRPVLTRTPPLEVQPGLILRPTPPSPQPIPGNWKSLADFSPLPGDNPPSRVRFPDGTMAFLLLNLKG